MIFNSYQNHLLFTGMAAATKHVLFEPRRSWAADRLKYNVHLKVVHGPGDNAYHQHRSNDVCHKIVYGKGRISRYSEATAATGCAGYGELTKRYSHVPLTPLNLLSHLVVHEFCHFVQVCKGQRYQGSVHNDEFYKILDRSYEKDINQQVSKQIVAMAKEDVDLLRHIESELSTEGLCEVTDIYYGNKVGFKSKEGEFVSGIITKINDKSVALKTPYGSYTVPKSLLEQVS